MKQPKTRMALFRKKTDLVSERAQALNERIATLEAQIRKLSDRLDQAPPPPPRETAAAAEPVFEPINQARLQAPLEPTATPEHYNELGLRKFDLAASVARLVNSFRGPATSNPKLVNYLAAGSVQGLRPLRYERRVARNRFIVLAAFFVLLLWGVLAVFLNHR